MEHSLLRFLPASALSSAPPSDRIWLTLRVYYAVRSDTLLSLERQGTAPGVQAGFGFSPKYSVCLPKKSHAGGNARYARTRSGC